MQIHLTIWTLCAAVFFCQPLLAFSRFANLSHFDDPIELCAGKVDLRVAREYFVEIENELPGMADYNALIRLYQKKEWSEFDTALATFEKVFETSPLQEAAAFLKVQALYDRLESLEDEGFKEAETAFRQVAILYPNSTLLPVIYASVGGVYLKLGNYTKSAAVFLNGKDSYPFHKLNCHYQFGIAESHYQINNYSEAVLAFKQLLQKCDGSRLRLGAELRMLDIDRKTKGGTLVKAYEKLYEKQGAMIERFYPWNLFNLGEFKYREAAFSSSQFFFERFQKYGLEENGCLPWGAKRLADISFKRKEKEPNFVGKYLAVKDRYPKSDIAIYSYIHGLLLGYQDVSPAERERRIRVIDDEIEKIKDAKLQAKAFLEKGLALLEAGDKEALEYLGRIHERTQINIEKGELAEFVREKLMIILKNEVAEVKSSLKKNDFKKDEKLFEPIESAYVSWLKGSPFENQARIFYRDIVLSRFAAALSIQKYKTGFSKLERWAESELWSKKGADDYTRKQVGETLAKTWTGLIGKDAKLFAAANQEYKEVLDKFTDQNYSRLDLATLLELDDREGLSEKISALKKKRNVASNSISSASRAYMDYIEGKTLSLLREFKSAEVLLKKSEIGDIKLPAQKERMSLYSRAGWPEKQVSLGLELVNLVSKEEKKSVLETVRKAGVESKQWKVGPKLLEIAKKEGVTEEELAPYQALVGRNFFEHGKWKEAIQAFDTALKSNPNLEGQTELRFRTAKALLKLKKKEDAKKILEEVSKGGDEFFSGLAKNELALLEVK